jgi:hypothetical protein
MGWVLISGIRRAVNISAGREWLVACQGGGSALKEAFNA